ncbi:hypothetical protein [Sphingomonas daechungensis]|uniref:hypothetical protein n=1 Tax=Sphingomonas daechungensis TaxID=1176646 RepID=UPI001CB8DCD7|nr:hypothetical protein [Sphingomonas daechungensis]
MRVVNLLHDGREEAVRKHHLLEQAEGDQRQAEVQLMRSRSARVRELGHQLGRPHDRTRDQVREEGHEQRIIQEVLRRLRPPEVDVQRVGQGREGVEADPDRQDDVPLRRLVIDADRRREHDEILEQELAVLEIAEHADVHDHRDDHPHLARPLLLRAHHPLGRPPVDDGRNPQ